MFTEPQSFPVHELVCTAYWFFTYLTDCEALIMALWKNSVSFQSFSFGTTNSPSEVQFTRLETQLEFTPFEKSFILAWLVVSQV